MDTIILAIAGGITSAFAGWKDSGEIFDKKKFGKSVLFAVISGILAGIYSESLTPVSAFAGGAGVDVLSNRILSVIRKK